MTLAATRRRTTLARERKRVLPALERRVAIAVGGYFRGMLPRIEAGVRRVAGQHATKADPDLVDAVSFDLSTIAWDQETRVLSTVVRPVIGLVIDAGAEAVSLELGESFDLSARPVSSILGDVGTRIRQVTDVSRQRIAREVAEGVEKGLSVEQIVRGVRPGTVNVRGPVPAFRGIRGLVDSWASTGAPGFAGRVGTVPLRSSRAYLIALTETGNAFNRSAIESYRASGLVDFVEVFDGPDCGWSQHNDPELAHGSVRTLDQAKARPLAHPRCQRSFGARLDARKPAASPWQGRDRSNVPGATPGLRPDDLLPLSGRSVARAPAARSPFGAAGGEAAREAALAKATERVRYTRTHEDLVVVDDDGNVLLDKSDPTQPRGVPVSAAEGALMRGTTAVHNHPLAYQENLPRATAFSPDDGVLAATYKVREMRVSGKGADFVLRIDPEVRPTELAEKIARMDREVRDDFSRSIARGELEIKDAMADHWHEVWTRLAAGDPTAIFYERTLRPEIP